MNNENEFELGGVKYVAKETPREQGCEGCAFNIYERCTLYAMEYGFMPCISELRLDGRHVIFVRKDEEQ